MKKSIILQNKKIAYTLRKSRRAHRMRLAVYCDGSIVVTAPFNLQENVAEKFIHEKTQWLFSKLYFFKGMKGGLATHNKYTDYIRYKDQARCVIDARAAYFCTMLGYTYNKINIKNQKTRWGSCSRKGNLNFNYKILFLPEKIRDYIIVHELCHLKEFNHSRKFWNLVEKAIPDYNKIKADLKGAKLAFY